MKFLYCFYYGEGCFVRPSVDLAGAPDRRDRRISEGLALLSGGSMLKQAHEFCRRTALFSVLFALCVLTVSLSGCADNTVRLLFRPAPAGTIVDPYAPTLAVLQFEDKRPEVWIGRRMGENGGYFQAGSSVPEWVSRSLADELVLHGVKASYAEDEKSAEALKAEHTLAGELLQVWVTEINPTKYQVEVRFRVTMKLADRTWSETFFSTQERSGMPGSAIVEELLNDALRSAVNSAAAKIRGVLAQ